MTWDDKSYYKGQFYGDFFHGSGTLVTPDEIIRGEWKKSKLNGQGERILLADDSRYSGKWIQGKLTGPGEFHSPSETYIGHFSNNLEHGTGKKVFSDGTIYDGKWQNGLPHGFGKHTYPDQSIYKGNYEEGFRQGQGTYECKEYRYSGGWQNDKYHGRGHYRSTVYNIEYDGEFDNGIKTGFGKLTYGDG